METCATCQSELAAEWKFCVHCGTPVPTRTIPADVRNLGTAFATTGVTAVSPAPDAPGPDPDPIPAAFRPEPGPSHRRFRFDGRLAFGIAMAAVGLLVVLYAVISLLGSRG